MTNGAIMKPNVTKFSLVALAMWALAACSTGSSGYQPPVPVNDSQNTSAQSATMSVPVENSGSGAAIIMAGQDAQATNTRIQLDQANVNRVTVDGMTFDLTQLNSDSWRSDAAKYADVVAAIIFSSENQNGKDVAFYTGNPTSNMPISGTAVYNGEAAIMGEHIMSDDELVVGTSHFNANFTDKTMSGRLNFEEGIGQINITATINNNQFNGSATAVNNAQIRSSGNVEGKFYGVDAKSLGGFATGTDRSWNAAFVAGKE